MRLWRSVFEPLILLGLGLATCTIAALAGRLEATPYLNQGLTAEERTQILASGALSPGLSRESYQMVVGDCVNNLRSLYMLTRPTDERDAAEETCLGIARRSVAAMPTFSFGWFAVADIESDLDRDIPAFNQALENSQITGPGEQWIAESRAELAESRFTDLSPEALAGHEADLRLLVQSPHGIGSIASRYVDDPGFRERIIAIVETLPPDVQAAFVERVRSAAGAP